MEQARGKQAGTRPAGAFQEEGMGPSQPTQHHNGPTLLQTPWLHFAQSWPSASLISPPTACHFLLLPRFWSWFLFISYLLLLRDPVTVSQQLPRCHLRSTALTSPLLLFQQEAQCTQHLMKLHSKCQQQLINCSLQRCLSTFD